MDRSRLATLALLALLAATTSRTALAQGSPPLPPCVGDCNGDELLTVDELVRGVNIALGSLALGQCPSFDANQDGSVTVDELVRAVDGALRGCEPDGITPAPTDTPGSATPTPTPDSGTSTPTTGPLNASIPRRAAGAVVTSSQTFLGVAHLAPLLLALQQQAGAGSGGGTGISIPCVDGSFTVSCVRVPPRTGPPTYQLTATGCTLPTSTGTLLVDGTARLIDQGAGHNCLTDRPQNSIFEAPELTITLSTTVAESATILSNVVGAANLSGSDPQCTYDTLTLEVSGTIRNETGPPGGAPLAETEAVLEDVAFVVEVDRFADGCVPELYSLTVEGDVTTTTNENTFAASYDAYTLAVDADEESSRVQVSGDVTSECYGATVGFTTTTPIEFPGGDACPVGGTFETSSGARDRVEFTSEGGVRIDRNADGGEDESFGNCLDPRLFACPG